MCPKSDVSAAATKLYNKKISIANLLARALEPKWPREDMYVYVNIRS